MEHENVVGQNKPSTDAPYGNTYNPNWRNHPNLSWKPKPPPYVPPSAQHQQQEHTGSTSQQQQLQSSSPVEQAIMNLSKVVGNYVVEHKAVNAHANQKIDAVESTLNKKIDNLQFEIFQKYDNLQYSISRLTNQQHVLEKGKFPSQTQPNPRGMHELSSSGDPNHRNDEVKAMVTLRSGREVKPSAHKSTVEYPKVVEPELEGEAPKGETVNKSTPPPFPQALRNKKKAINQTEILEVLRQVKVNIPLLDMIKQVPTYAKFLKDLCTVKRGFNVNKKAFLTEQVSAIIECKTPIKYKDPGCPTI